MKRKTFLRNSAIAAALGFLPGEKLFAYDKSGASREFSNVKITAVKPYVFDRGVFVKIESSEGVSGWGEGDSDYPSMIAKAVEVELKDHVIGKDPFDSEHIWFRMYFKGFDMGNSGILTGAISAIDNALWDLKGKLLNMPVYKLLGGADQEKVKVYGSFGRSRKGGYLSPKEMAEEAATFAEQGYKVIKARMQIRQFNVDPSPDPTYHIIKEIRKAIGDEIEIYVDYNNGYSSAKAIVLTKKLYEHFNISLVEEPVTQQNYNELKQVVDAVDIPVSAGEHEYNKWQFRELITLANVDYLNTDVIKCGGITECRKVAGMAQAFDKQIMVHNARPTLATAASLQFLGSLVNSSEYQEYGGRRENLGLWPLFENSLEYNNGYLKIPQEPGLGLIPNEKAMEAKKLN